MKFIKTSLLVALLAFSLALIGGCGQKKAATQGATQTTQNDAAVAKNAAEPVREKAVDTPAGADSTQGKAAAVSGERIFVANEEDGSVSVIDALSREVIKTISIGSGTHNLQVSPDGKTVWVTVLGSSMDHGHGNGDMKMGGEVWAIDTDSFEVLAKVTVGEHPAHVILTPDGKEAFVTNGGSNTVSVIDAQNYKPLAEIPVGDYPHGLRPSPDGKLVYVADINSGDITVIDTQSRETTRIPVGKKPVQVGFTPDGKTAFVSLNGENAVVFIDVATSKVKDKVRVGKGPVQVYATPDGRHVYVANQGTKDSPSNTVSIVDIATRKTVQTIEVNDGAHGVVIDGAGKYAYITNLYDNSVSMIDTASMKVVARIPVGRSPNGISITPTRP